MQTPYQFVSMGIFDQPANCRRCLLASAVLRRQKYQGDSWATVKSKGSGVLTVVYSEQFGLVAKDKDGKVKGVCVDILSDFARYIKEKYGKQLTIEYAGAIPVFSSTPLSPLE
jgi:hypothetical protein